MSGDGFKIGKGCERGGLATVTERAWCCMVAGAKRELAGRL